MGKRAIFVLSANVSEKIPNSFAILTFSRVMLASLRLLKLSTVDVQID